MPLPNAINSINSAQYVYLISQLLMTKLFPCSITLPPFSSGLGSTRWIWLSKLFQPTLNDLFKLILTIMFTYTALGLLKWLQLNRAYIFCYYPRKLRLNYQHRQISYYNPNKSYGIIETWPTGSSTGRILIHSSKSQRSIITKRFVLPWNQKA